MQQRHCAGRTFLQRSSCTRKETANRSVKVDDMEALEGVHLQALSLGCSSPDQANHYLGPSTGRVLLPAKMSSNTRQKYSLQTHLFMDATVFYCRFILEASHTISSLSGNLQEMACLVKDDLSINFRQSSIPSHS